MKIPMKTLFTLLMIFLSYFAFGQTIDTAAVRAEIDSLIPLYVSQSRNGQVAKSLSNNQKAAELVQLLENEKVLQARVYLDLSISYFRMRNINEIERWVLKSKNIIEKEAGKRHHVYLECLNVLSAVHQIKGEHSKAEAVGIEVTTAMKEVYGATDKRYLGAMVNLGHHYSLTANFEKALKIYREVKMVFEEDLGRTDDAFYLNCMLQLGEINQRLGKYRKAEEYLLNVKETFESSDDYQLKEEYINCLNKIALLYHEIGLLEKYESLELRIKKLLTETVGTQHVHYAGALINLSGYYLETGAYDKAEKFLLESKTLFESSENPEMQPFYFRCLENMAILNLKTGDFEKAEDFSLKALAYSKKLKGDRHPDFAKSQILLANIYQSNHRYSEAISLYENSLEVLKESGSEKQATYTNCLYQLGKTFYLTGQYENAERCAKKQNSLNHDFLSSSIYHLSEQELGEVIQKFSTDNKLILSLALSAKKENKHIVTAAYNNALLYKGFLLNAAEATNNIFSPGTEADKKFKQLKYCHRRLAQEYSKPISARDSTSIIDFEEQSNSLEKELVGLDLRYEAATKQILWQDIKSQLKPNQAAVEFVQFQPIGQNETQSTLYAALILNAKNEQPIFIPLFDENDLSVFFNQNKDNRKGQVNSIYEKNSKTYKLIWEPLENELKGCETVYFSPVGLLHRINLNAILQNEKSEHGNTYKLVQLNSTRKLAIPFEIKNNENKALLFGGINYEIDTTSLFSENIIFEKDASRGSLSFSQSGSFSRGGSWEYLEWTEVEVSAIESILNSNEFQVELNKGNKASEEKFKTIPSPSPRIFHIATHGYFFPDPKTVSDRYLGDGEPAFKISDHPMIRSGLIMAGGNHAWKTGKPFKPGMEDGILTAYEISQMDLSNTELVVLSACETGLGDIDGNEGVYGLQRAFKIAGAKYLIMSLWQVPDYPTQQLMTIFYNNWLSKNMEIPDAFRAAQDEMKERFNDPFMWAGFVLVE